MAPPGRILDNQVIGIREMNEAERRPLTDGYARQTLLQRLRKMGVKKEDITPEMIELERAKLEGVRTLREYKKRTKDF